MYDFFVQTIDLIIPILITIATWLIFTKAGEDGWKALIPFYSTYTEFKIVGKTKYFLPWLIAAIINLVTVFILIFYLIGNAISSMLIMDAFDHVLLANMTITILVLSLIIGISLIVCAVFTIILRIEQTKVFNLSPAFAIGLVLLPVVFLSIIAFNPNIQYTKILNTDKEL